MHKKITMFKQVLDAKTVARMITLFKLVKFFFSFRLGFFLQNYFLNTADEQKKKYAGIKSVSRAFN